MKLENILLSKFDEELQVKIADLGFAKQLKSGDGMAITSLGTPLTMAPEIHESKFLFLISKTRFTTLR